MENLQEIGLQVAIIGCKLALLCFDKAITLCSSVNSPGDGPAVVMFGEKGSREALQRTGRAAEKQSGATVALHDARSAQSYPAKYVMSSRRSMTLLTAYQSGRVRDEKAAQLYV